MKFTTDKIVFDFCKDNTPIAAIDVPATIEVATKDCFSNQLREPGDTLDALDWDDTNPATGPIFINGAQPGDTLKVTIDKIDVDAKGTVCAIEGEGTIGHKVVGSHSKIVPVKDGFAEFSDDIKIPIKPMIGVIGVTGLEIPADVTITVEIIKGQAPEYPILENNEVFSVIVSKETVDEAADAASELMLEFLEPRMDMKTEEIVMLMSLVGNVEICQIVDPLKTVRFVFPKKYMTKATF